MINRVFFKANSIREKLPLVILLLHVIVLCASLLNQTFWADDSTKKFLRWEFPISDSIYSIFFFWKTGITKKTVERSNHVKFINHTRARDCYKRAMSFSSPARISVRYGTFRICVLRTSHQGWEKSIVIDIRLRYSLLFFNRIHQILYFLE